MSDPYIGEILIFAGNFAPLGWAFCNGQSMPISQNETLFGLIRTTYGGDGRENFKLPDLQGRVPVHTGQGSGMSGSYPMGETGGLEQVLLTQDQMPSHTHLPLATVGINDDRQTSPADAVWAEDPTYTFSTYYQTGTTAPATTPMSARSVGQAGGAMHHDNMQPYLALNFCISLSGLYPGRSEEEEEV